MGAAADCMGIPYTLQPYALSLRNVSAVSSLTSMSRWFCR
jgi:hypothetical protein